MNITEFKESIEKEYPNGKWAETTNPLEINKFVNRILDEMEEGKKYHVEDGGYMIKKDGELFYVMCTPHEGSIIDVGIANPDDKIDSDYVYTITAKGDTLE